MHTVLTLATPAFTDWVSEQTPWLNGLRHIVQPLRPEDDRAQYGQERYNLLCWDKVRFAVQALRTMEQDELLWLLDADVILTQKGAQFLEGVEALMNQSSTEFAAQHDPDTGACTGCIVMRNTSNVRRIVNQWCALRSTSKNDQIAFNEMRVPHYLLPKEMVASYGNLVGGVWNGQDFEIPRTIAAFHCNYVVGLDAKNRMRSLVKSKLAA